MRKILTFLIIGVLLGVLIPATPVTVLGATTNVEVSLQDNVVDRPNTYYICFVTPSVLEGGRDTITIKFPSAVQISESISQVNISINDRDVPGINFENNTLTMLIPSQINISAGSTVEVGIASAVIKNPKVAGNYYITLNTSKDTQEVTSAAFFINDYEYANGVSKPSVNLVTSSNDVHEYNITFKTSVNGSLSEGTDSIFLVFPNTTDMPSYIAGVNVMVNGQELSGQQITINGRILSFKLPANLNISAGGKVEVVIKTGAGIKNTKASEYNTMRVYTSKETREITSFPYEVSGTTVTNQTKPIEVIPSPNGTGLAAAYTIKIQPYALQSLSSNLSGFILIFPSKTEFPANISSEDIKVNGKAVRGVLCNPDKKEIIFTLLEDINSSQSIEIAIAQDAGLKNPVPAQYKVEVKVLMGTTSKLSEFYTISEATTTSSGTQGTSLRNIRLSIDSIIATVDGAPTILDAVPVITNNVTMVPLRFVATALGAQADYYASGNYVIVKYGTKEMTLWVNSNLAKVNGSYTSLGAPATIINGRLMVPIRFISENFGANVQWDGVTRSITIQQTGGSTGNTGSSSSTSVNQYPIGYICYVRAGNSYANLRQGPGQSYPLAGKVLPGQMMTILLVEGDWYRIKLENSQEVWIASWMVDVKV